MQLLYGKDDLQTPIATTISRTKPERTCNDERSGKDLQIGPAICKKIAVDRGREKKDY
jgi:hypothetical protein